jgi:hypothetical protein
METMTLIVSALVDGATAARKDITGDAAKDAYAGLKRLILDRYGEPGAVAEAVAQIDAKPASEGWQLVLREELAETPAPRDKDVLRAAQRLLAIVAPDRDTSITVTATDHAIAVGGNVGGSVTTIHGDGNVVGDYNKSWVKK